jgi:ribosome-associated toxin RatA of RatAB toxin-antitoxin module
MAIINKALLVPYTPQQMYDLINDVEAYPDFLPWCKSATVHSREATKLSATIGLSKGPLNYSITTVNTMRPHSEINMSYAAGPFKSCAGSWKFLEHNNTSQCQILFHFAYEFTNRLAGLAIEPIFYPITNTLVDAFYQRAIVVYGK